MFRTLRKRSYVYRLTEPDVLEPSRLEVNKTYVLGAQLGSTAGLLGACLLPYQMNAQDAGRPKDLLVA
jgi:glucokinase